MGGRTGKAIAGYVGAAPGVSEAGTPQAIVSQGPTTEQTSNAVVTQGTPQGSGTR